MELLTPSANLLLDIYKRQKSLGAGYVDWSQLHKDYGSKLYQQAYRLALLGYIVIEGEGRGKTVKLTEKGERISECLLSCVSLDNSL